MDGEKLESFVRAAFASAGVPGAVLHVVDCAGARVTVEHGDLTAHDPVTLGSTSKSLAATLLMLLVGEGRVALDDSVRRHLPDVDLPPETTLLDLARHVSGLTSDARPARLSRTRSGSFRYANQNYNLLGAALAEAAGRDYAALLTERVLRPLRMARSWCSPHRPVAPGYSSLFGLRLRRKPFDAGPRSWVQGASGAVVATAQDAGRYLTMLLRGGLAGDRRLLAADSVERMLNDVVPADGSPAVAGPLGDRGEYGLGWVRKRCRGQRVHLHVGKVPGGTSVFVLLPEAGLGFVLLANICDFFVATPLMEECAEGVIRLLLGDESAPPASRSGARLRQAAVNGGCAAFLALSGLGWLGLVPGGVAVAVAYHALLPICLLVGLRRAAGAPWPWLLRFAPDVAGALVVGCASMLAAGAVRLVAG